VYYPSGIRYPFVFGSAGGVRVEDGSAKVMSDMVALIKTNINERIIRKAVGTVGYSLILRSNVGSNSGVIEELISEAIIQWVPSITGVSVKVYEEPMDDGSTGIFADVGFSYVNTGERVTSTLQLYE
jgi:hypothetical protein